MKKGDLDLLLRKAVESKVCDFKQFCDALVKYAVVDLEKEPTSTSLTPKVYSLLFKTTLAILCSPAKREPSKWSVPSSPTRKSIYSTPTIDRATLASMPLTTEDEKSQNISFECYCSANLPWYLVDKEGE